MKTELSGHYSVRRLILTSIPIIGMMIITSVYSIVDGFFIANFAGSTEFASMNLIWPAISLVSAIGLMIGSGGSALVSKTLGEGNNRKANEIFSQLIRICIEFGIVAGTALIIFMKPLVIALGARGQMIELAVTYGRIVSAAMPLFIVQMAFQSFFMTAERPELGTRMSIICGLLNISLDALFIIGFGWGLAGAAVATAIALATGGAYPLVFFSKSLRKQRNRSIILSSTGNEEHTSTLSSGSKADFSSGPAKIQLVESAGRDWTSIVKSCSNGVSAYGIIMYVGFIFAAVFIGYNLCVSQVIAFNYGAGNTAELRSLFSKSLLIIGLSGIALTGIAELSAHWLSAVFVGHNASLSELTTHAIRIYMLSFLLCGFNMFCSAWFTALGNGPVSAVAAFARTMVFELATVFILPRILGIDGIWSTVCVAEILAFILTCTLFMSFRQRYLGNKSHNTRVTRVRAIRE